MRVVQALYWSKDLLPSDRRGIMLRLKRVLSAPADSSAIRDDLKAGLPTMPAWMQAFVRELLAAPPAADRKIRRENTKAVKRNRRPSSPRGRTRQHASHAERA
jgi:hypothetical protein